MKEFTSTRLAIDQILVGDKTRVRARVDPKLVKEYTIAIKNGAIFPAIVVFAEKGSSRYFMGDGEHRLLACIEAGKKTVGVEVHQGNVHDALHYALSCNDQHGQRRSNADKRHAVQMALGDRHYDDWSLRQISELCVVSHMLVRDVKTEENEKASGKDKNSSRPRKAKPTQAEVDLKLLRGALAVIKGFPYSGEKLVQRLGLTPDDEKDLRFVEGWIRETRKK